MTFALGGSLYAKKPKLKQYKVDWEPLKKSPALYQEFQSINGKDASEQSRKEMKRALKIVEKVLKKIQIGLMAIG